MYIHIFTQETLQKVKAQEDYLEKASAERAARDSQNEKVCVCVCC